MRGPPKMPMKNAIRPKMTIAIPMLPTIRELSLEFAMAQRYQICDFSQKSDAVGGLSKHLGR
jgi:hypothetical protein